MKKTRDPEIFLRGGVYWYRGTPVSGKGELKCSLGVRSFGKARQAKRDLLNEITGIDPKKNKNIKFRELAEDFVKSKESVSQSAKNKARAASHHLVPFFGDYPLKTFEEQGEDLVREFIKFERERIALFKATEGREGRRSERLANDIAKLNEILLRGYKRGFFKQPLKFKNPDPKKNPRRPLSPDELKRLLEAARPDPYLWCFVIVAVTLGPRPGEHLKAEWRHIDFDRGTLGQWHIPAENNKNHRDRTISLSAQARGALLALRAVQESKKDGFNGWVYPARYKAHGPHLKTIDGPFKRALTDAGLATDLVAYNLRHTFCTNAARQIREGKTTIVHVCRFADHDINTFNEHYLHLTPEDTEVVAGLVEVPL